jgi:hypothetical protein
MIPSLLIIAPAIVGAIYFKSLPKLARVLWYFIIVTTLLDALASYLGYYKINNLWLFHLYSYIEFGFISYIYFHLIRRRRVRLLILVMLGIFLILSLINLFGYEGIKEFNSIQRHIEGFILVLYCVDYLMELAHDKKRNSSWRNPYYMLTIGFLIYFTGTLYLFVFGNSIVQQPDDYYWLLHTFFHTILLAIYTLFLWRTSRGGFVE